LNHRRKNGQSENLIRTKGEETKGEETKGEEVYLGLSVKNSSANSIDSYEVDKCEGGVSWPV